MVIIRNISSQAITESLSLAEVCLTDCRPTTCPFD